MHGQLNAQSAGATSVPSPFERLYTPAELAKLWQLSEQSIRRLFQDEPGVFVLGTANPRGRRGYTTLRIPGAVVQKVFEGRVVRNGGYVK